MAIILSIAGSDSGGGAGVQADLKTAMALGHYATTAIVAITAQNTMGVVSTHELPVDVLEAQVRAILDDFTIHGAKTGMLSSARAIEMVARLLEEVERPFPLVVDPVMVSKNGTRLLHDSAVDALRRRLFPLATIATPNLDEVGELLGARPTKVEEMEEAARELGKVGPKAILVKGGHLPGGPWVTDVLWDGREIHRFVSPRLDVAHTHGTGCTLSAALACYLAEGHALAPAVFMARRYLYSALHHAYAVGRGTSPVNHGWQPSPAIDLAT